jgi:GNAT superfamily N-acetyltransferase
MDSQHTQLRTPSRLLTSDDLPEALRLSGLAGWNQLESDWRLFLNLRPEGARAIESSAGVLAGTVTTLDLGAYAWIAMLLVDPQQRRRGIGSALLGAVLEELRPFPSIGLDATPEGRMVYRQHGFEDREELARFVREGAPPGPPAVGGDPDGGLPVQVIGLDKEATGAERGAVLRSLHGRAPELAAISDEGFLLGRLGRLALHLGPLIASGRRHALRLLQLAVRANSAQRMLLDAPLRDPAWLDELTELGFRPVRRFTRMFRGQPARSGGKVEIFAAIGPEFS